VTESPLISLAVIVRDETARLPALLDGHRGLWDEAVVVDTGSRDDSAAVAAAHGARVRAFAWVDDFAAARNAAIDACAGRWALVLDADEHIAAADQARLREAVAAAGPGGLVLPQWNYVDDPRLPGWRPVVAAAAADARGAGGYVVARQVRLFPPSCGARYRGRIHESVEPDLLARGLELVPVDVPVHHHGHRGALADRDARSRRNDALLRRKLREDPADPRARLELAAHLLGRGQLALAARLLEHLVAEAPDGPAAADAWRLLGHLRLTQERHPEAVAACRRALTVRPDLPDGWPDLIRALWLAGDRPGARAACARFAALFPDDPRLPALTAQVQGGTADIA
jgi:tetratricopeptide (TPR) repeat protein